MRKKLEAVAQPFVKRLDSNGDGDQRPDARTAA
jgi:hypothetical protein